jgi:hypothetical protein
MSESSKAKQGFRWARDPEAEWTPTSAGDFRAELAISHPHYTIRRFIGNGGMGAV